MLGLRLDIKPAFGDEDIQKVGQDRIVTHGVKSNVAGGILGHRCQRPNTKKPSAFSYKGLGRFVLEPDNDLLSHGETPHYHRR